MLPCKQTDCCWHLVCLDWVQEKQPGDLLDLNKGTKMSDTTSLGLARSAGLFSRFMATIDRLLMASAAIANRNHEPPYFGL
jgi:hypothetical protein